MLSSQQGFRSSLSRFHCVGLQHFREREGLSQQRALGCFRFHANLVALRVLPTLQNGVSVLGSRWGGQPVFRSLCARSPGCGCFCLRLDFQVTVSVRGSQGAWVLSAFSTRTLPSTGVPARRVQGASAWACLWFVALLHVVVRFRAVHRCCVLGCGFPLKISLWLSCLHCVGFQQFGGSGRGFRSSGLLAASGFTQIWLHLVFCRCFRTGCQSSARGGGGSASFALALRSLSRLRLFLFEARLSGYCVREAESRESTLDS